MDALLTDSVAALLAVGAVTLTRLPQMAEIKSKQGKKAETARVSTTDAEATVMKMADGGDRPAYNGQFVSDTASQEKGPGSIKKETGTDVLLNLAPYPFHNKFKIMSKDELLARISVAPGVCFGKPCIRGHRIWVSLVLDLLAAGWSHREILENYPGLDDADVLACIAYGAEMTRERYIDIELAHSA